MPHFVTLLLVTVFCVSPHGSVTKAQDLPLDILREAQEAGAEQIIWIYPQQASDSRAILTTWQQDSQWRTVFHPIQAVIGVNGLAAEDEKREGDGRSPYGVFPLTFVLGAEPSVESRMPYHPISARDIWVNDPEAPDYNTLTTIEKTKAKSFEKLRRSDNLYDQVIVVGYNSNPIEPGMGSAIFLHIWNGPDSSTAGCGAFSADDMKRLLRWLDPEKRPHVIFMPRPPFYQ